MNIEKRLKELKNWLKREFKNQNNSDFLLVHLRKYNYEELEKTDYIQNLTLKFLKEPLYNKKDVFKYYDEHCKDTNQIQLLKLNIVFASIEKEVKKIVKIIKNKSNKRANKIF